MNFDEHGPFPQKAFDPTDPLEAAFRNRDALRQIEREAVSLVLLLGRQHKERLQDPRNRSVYRFSEVGRMTEETLSSALCGMPASTPEELDEAFRRLAECLSPIALERT